MEPRVWRTKVAESGTRYHRARLVDRNNAVLDQSSFTGTILVKVYDLDAAVPDVAAYEGSNTIATWVYNSLQTWEDDGIGYNFEGSVTSNQYAYSGGHTYRVCFYLRRSSPSTEGELAVLFENVVEWQLGT